MVFLDACRRWVYHIRQLLFLCQVLQLACDNRYALLVLLLHVGHLPHVSRSGLLEIWVVKSYRRTWRVELGQLEEAQVKIIRDKHRQAVTYIKGGGGLVH